MSELRSYEFWCFFLLSLAAGCLADLCVNPTTSDLSDALKTGVIPRGAAAAGVFTYDKQATTLLDCVDSCCNTRSCEVMYYVKDQCLLIACNRTWPAGCDPSLHKDKNFESTYYLRVRTPDEVAYLHPTTTTTTKTTTSMAGCLLTGCDAGAECQLVAVGDATQYVCQCTTGYELDTKSGECRLSGAPAKVITDTSRVGGHADTGSVRYCTFGLTDQCKENERCVARQSILRSQSGLCKCLPDFNHDAVSDRCIPAVATVVKRPSTNNESLGNATSLELNTTSSLLVSSVTSPTSTVPPVVQPSIEPLVVSAGTNHEIQLPKDDITLFAYVLDDTNREKYKYQWSLFLHPDGEETGEMVDINSYSLKLSKLRAGLYTFKVSVSAEGKYGETYVNVTVLPPARVNQPPVAVAKPSSQEVNQPNDLVIDGSASTDDDKVVSYHWEQVSGKLISQKTIDASDLDKPMLVLKGLAPGSYRFKLTVTDSDGVTNETYADATINKEIDYPPTANAGSNVIMSLPQNSVTLYGNASTDDKGIVSYEWTKTSDDKLAVGMVGVRTAFLRLDNLVVGDYTFRLKVTDAAGQESTADVRVFVKPEHNQPPVASAGVDTTIWLPTDVVTLDGSNSTDDQKIESYEWTIVSGPAVTIENADRAVATASKLNVGQYKFKLTVKDNEGLTDSRTVTITIKQNENQAPVADAGGDQVIILPAPLVTLNGSRSTDDRGIVSYAWTRDPTSPAAGTIVPGTDHQRVLQITSVIAGRYVFTLEVTDATGLSSVNSASVIVKPANNQLDLIRLQLSADIHSFTEMNKLSLENELALLLHRSSFAGETKVFIEEIAEDGSSGQTLVTFYAMMVTAKHQVVRSGVEVVSTLKTKLRSSADILDFQIISLDTLVCQNNCSGHGQCNQASKRCVCAGFWMEDLFRTNFGDQQSNCDWSILYVIIVVFVLVLMSAALTWGIWCTCRRCSRLRPKVKRHRYALLEDLDDTTDKSSSNGKLELLPSGNTQRSSLMHSESDVSSEEETIFIQRQQQQRANGFVATNNNGGVPRKVLVSPSRDDAVSPRSKVTA